MIKICICDDDKADRDRLEKLLVELSVRLNTTFTIVKFSSGEELLANRQRFEIIFMDIIMNDIDGIKTLELLDPQNELIIFMSSTSDRIKDLFRENVIGFLEKPIDIEKLGNILQKAYKIMLKYINYSFSFPKNGGTAFIHINEILFLESIGHHINIYTKDEIITYRGTIKEAYEKLKDSELFIKPHRSFLVNIKYLSFTSKTTIKIKYLNIEIPLSRIYKEETTNKILKYLNSKGENND